MPAQYTVLALAVPAAFVDETLRELDLRVRYGITVLAIRTETAPGYEDRLPQPDQPLQEGDTLILAGPREDITQLQQQVHEASLPSP